MAVLATGAMVRLIAPLLTTRPRPRRRVPRRRRPPRRGAVRGAPGGGNDAGPPTGRADRGAPVLTTATDAARARRPRPAARPGGYRATWPGRRRPCWPARVWRSRPAGLAGARRPGRAGRPRRRRTSVVMTDRRRPPRSDLLLHPARWWSGSAPRAARPPQEPIGGAGCRAGRSGLARRASVGEIATIDRRRSHPAVTRAGRAPRGAGRGRLPRRPRPVAVPNPSATWCTMPSGTGSVAEAAALLAAGDRGRLVVEKPISPTGSPWRSPVAPAGVARWPSSGSGRVAPSTAPRPPSAPCAAPRWSWVLGYLEQCRDLLGARPARSRPSPRGRARPGPVRLGTGGRGRRVALVCSGDAGVYAMASPVLELADHARARRLPALCRRGRRAGARGDGVARRRCRARCAARPRPRGISLSDLHTPWEDIAARLAAAAQSDLCDRALQPPVGPAHLADRKGPGHHPRAHRPARHPGRPGGRRRPRRPVGVLWPRWASSPART